MGTALLRDERARRRCEHPWGGRQRAPRPRRRSEARAPHAPAAMVAETATATTTTTEQSGGPRGARRALLPKHGNSFPSGEAAAARHTPASQGRGGTSLKGEAERRERHRRPAPPRPADRAEREKNSRAKLGVARSLGPYLLSLRDGSAGSKRAQRSGRPEAQRPTP